MHIISSNQKQVLINGISGILGNKPNLKVIIQHVKAIADTQTEIRIVVMEKGVTGTSRKIPATDLANYLNQPAQKQQLTNVGVTSIVAYVTPSKAALEEYLKTVPLGIKKLGMFVLQPLRIKNYRFRPSNVESGYC